MKIVNILFKIILAKWIIFKPKRKSILIYDKQGEDIFLNLFEKKFYEVLDTRYESVNLFVIFKTLFKNGIKNFKNNYKLNYLIAVNPEYVFTGVDNNIAFYKLRNIYKKSIYISIQKSQRDEIFFEKCKKYNLSNPQNKLKVDYMFVIGKNDTKRYSEVLEGKIICLGSVKNNHFINKQKNFSGKVNSIIFISANNALNKARSFIEEDKTIFDMLYNFCSKNSIQLSLCVKNNEKYENFYRKRLIKGTWHYKPRTNPNSTYQHIMESDMAVFIDSSLGYETIAKGMKCAVFPIVQNCFPYKGHGKIYPKNGPFWSSEFNPEIMEKILKKVINFTQLEWSKIINDYEIQDIIHYDSGNELLRSELGHLKISFKENH